ncbi:hypothetical protein MMC20_007252 [Loxospora ochrophaea]|nr:hypothetical protein [Loxospora ochrophaea]
MEGSLVTQGSMDWVALSKSTINVSLEMLARFSGAGVEVKTIAMGQALCNNFSLPAAGQKRIADALSKLQAFSSYGNFIWFGFGIKHISRTLFETEEGATCMGLCACFSVSYDSHYAAKVFKTICDQSSVPGLLKPSIPQWAGLIDVCAGTVTASEFSHQVNGLVRILGSWKTAFDCSRIQQPTPPQALAAALLELAKVSNGSLRSVTLEGGVDLGWLAAVAQWLFCMSVEIIDASGNRLYASSQNINLTYTQVRILYQGREASNPSNTTLVSRSCFVPPGKLDLSSPALLPQHIFSSGRSKWSTILKDTFDTEVDRLLHPGGGSFAEYLCWGLRSMLHHSAGSWLLPIAHPPLKSEEQRFRAFLKFAATRLPELKDSLQSDQRTLFQVGVQKGEGFLRTYAQRCGCETCGRDLLKAGRQPRVVESTPWCLEQIAFVIFNFLWMLLPLDLDIDFQPSSNGLLLLYHDRSDHTTPAHIGSGSMVETIKVLTGRPTSEPSGVSHSVALSSNGVCIYRASLEDPTTPPTEQVRLRVVPGQIERDGVLFKAIGDIEGTSDMSWSDRSEMLAMVLRKCGSSPRLQLVFEETMHPSALNAMFTVSSSDPLAPQLTKPGVPGTSIAFGASQISSKLNQNVIEGLFRKGLCKRENLEITVPKALASTSETWHGQCFAAEPNFLRKQPQIKPYLPDLNEWFLTFSSCKSAEVGEHHLEILRGSPVVLYCVLCSPSPGIHLRHVHLACSPPCFACLATCCVFTRSDTWMKRRRGPITIHTLFEEEGKSMQIVEHIEKDPT